MAIRLLTETLNNQISSLGIPIGIAGPLTGGFSIHVNHVVNFAKPLAFVFRESSNQSQYQVTSTLDKAYWEGIGIQEGEKVTVCFHSSNGTIHTNGKSVYVNGGLSPAGTTGNNGGWAIAYIYVIEASDVIIMTAPHHNTVYDKYSMEKLLMHTSEGQFSDTELNEGYVTNVPGDATSKVTLRPNATLVQLEHRVRLNRTSPNSASSSVKVQIGTKAETRTLPLLGAPSKTVETIIIPVVLSEEPDNVVTDLSYTLNLTHQ